MEAKHGETAEKFTFTSLKTFYKFGDKNIDVSIYGLKDKSKYLPKLSKLGEKTGVYFSDGLAKKLKKKTGDMVAFVDPYTGDEYKMRIIETYDYPAGLAVFMSHGQLNALLNYEEVYFNGNHCSSCCVFIFWTSTGITC